MEWIENESEQGYYNVYSVEGGEKLIVLNGLDPSDVHIPTALESFIHTHYASIAGAYWIMFAILMCYLIAAFLLIPIYKRAIAVRKI